jgi:hypothetical protein
MPNFLLSQAALLKAELAVPILFFSLQLAVEEVVE